MRMIIYKYWRVFFPRGGHHRYSIDAEGTSTSTKDISTNTSNQLRHHLG